MLRRAFLLLAGFSGLTSCSPAPSPVVYRGPTGYAPAGAAPSNQKVAILLPLSGPRADIGQPMLQAGQLALAAPGSPPLISEDTGGTPQGAAGAVRAALAAGATFVLGPLTAPEVSAASPAARGANVPMLAFSNDPAVAAPGVWLLGITPDQQVRRLASAAQQAGKTRFAALLPDTDFGRAMASALGRAATQDGLAPPNIQFHGSGMGAINQSVKSISDYDARWGPIEAQIRAARAEGTAAGRQKAEQLSHSVLPPPPFDALLLADTGDAVAELASVLPYYFVTQPAVQLMGPSLWADPRSGSRQLSGAWYAAADPAARTAFVQAFTARYGTPPPGAADLAFDAASIARVVSTGVGTLTTPDGFTGADGWLALLPDGGVRRGLAVFSIEAGGPQIVQPAPTNAGMPGT
jgi:ABC-type branched-subunit amino acid transport system substrate-binding protein